MVRSVRDMEGDMEPWEWEGENRYFGLLQAMYHLGIIDWDLRFKLDNFVDYEWEPPDGLEQK